MSDDARKAADERLAAALASADLVDQREVYRIWMRTLKRQSASAFREATEHYEHNVLPRLTDSADPLGAWIEFGIVLAGMTGPGQTVSVDASGRSEAWHGDYERGRLVLYLPEDRQREAMPVAVPTGPSPAQEATIDLLVRKKLSL